MKTRKLFGVVCGSLALAACGGGGGGDGIADPAVVSFQINALSSNELKFTPNIGGSITIELMDGDVITVDSTHIVFDDPDVGLGTNVTVYVSDTFDVIEVFGGVELNGVELFELVRIDDIDSPLLGFETYAVVGDETPTLPFGGANYAGRFIATSFFGGSVLNAEDTNDSGSNFNYGNVDISADFGAALVDVTLTFDSVVSNNPNFGDEVLTGAGLSVTGSQYSGTISSSLGSYDLTGTLQGAFYGPDAAATAGTFSADDAVNNAEVIGGFTAPKL